MQTRIRTHIRSNVVGYVAMFIALVGGTAIAAQKAAKNSVVSTSIKNGAVKGKDVKSAQVQLRVGGTCPAGDAIRVINVGGGVLCDVDVGGGGRPSGPAGGSLTGDYPNPTLAPNSVGTSQIADDAVNSAKVANSSLASADVKDQTLTGGDVADNSLGGADVAESTLGQVPSALLGGFGRTGAQGSCDPSGATFITCASVNIGVTTPGRALVIGQLDAQNVSSNAGLGTCRLDTSTVGVIPNTTSDIFVDGLNEDFATIVGITPELPPGANSFGIDCNQSTAGGSMEYEDAAVTAVMISAS